MKTTKRENKSGTVRYLHLAHNEWDPVKGRAVPKVLFTFGREDQLDRDAVKRLVTSLSRLLDPGDALAATAASDLEFVSSVPFGGTYVLDHLWRRLKIDEIVARVGQPKRGRRRDITATERVLFALVANRALAPSSQLAAADWITHDAHVKGLPAVGEQSCYRAMDWLHEVKDDLEKQVFDEVANLLNLEVDLLFFDTTSTYFELGEPDEPVVRDASGAPADTGTPDANTPLTGFRTYGKSKDSRDDLPQIVIGMAVTRDGIPVRCWCWPGNASDQKLIRQVKNDMRDWTLSKIVWVTDRGFSSETNRRYLRQGDHAYIIREKLRSGSPEVKAALSRQGRYTEIADNMRVKEVRISDTDRFVICHNPEAAARDQHTRTQLVAHLEELIADTDKLSDFKRGELRGRIADKPGLNRYLRTTPVGKLRIDQARTKAEENLDGKYLLRCSDPHLSPEDIAHRARLQAAPRSRARLAGHEADHRPAARLSPPRRAHTGPCPPLLAHPPPHPHRRDSHRDDLVTDPPRPPAPPRRHLHRPHRNIPPGHRPHQAPDRPPGQARHPAPQAGRRPPAHTPLTSTNATA
ncbi:IS1634 family transposase [Streptomyces sp. NPDC000609]|uniref:IS1634 family transposase n=1 Tax=Streptomyces sp. NPDC000609 TaxID=3160957 RepID=UPI003393D6BC